MINGIYLPKKINTSTNKNTNIIDLQLNAKISELCREIDSNVIAQLVFVIEVFIQEINNILQAVYYAEANKSAKATQEPIPHPSTNESKT
jgi:hypothetical protein